MGRFVYACLLVLTWLATIPPQMKVKDVNAMKSNEKADEAMKRQKGLTQPRLSTSPGLYTCRLPQPRLDSQLSSYTTRQHRYRLLRMARRGNDHELTDRTITLAKGGRATTR